MQRKIAIILLLTVAMCLVSGFSYAKYVSALNESYGANIKVVPVSSIRIKGPSVIGVGQEATYSATVFPQKATDKTVRFFSSDNRVLSIYTNGKATARKPGTVKVYAAANGATATYTVKVIETPQLNFTEESFTLEEGSKMYLPLETSGMELVNGKIGWSSSNTSVVTVDGDGLATAVKEGTATITAKIGNVSAQCRVTVFGNKIEDDIIGIAFRANDKTYATYYSDGTALVANAIPYANPNTSVSATVYINNEKLAYNTNKIKYVAYWWNDDIACKVREPWVIVNVPDEGKLQNTLHVMVVTSEGKEFKASMTFKNKSAMEGITLTFSAKGKMLAEYHSDSGVSIQIDEKITLKAGVNMIADVEVANGSIDSVYYNWDDSMSGKGATSYVEGTKTAKIISACPSWTDGRDYHILSVTVVTRSGSTYTRSITVYKPTAEEDYIKLEMISDDKVYMVYGTDCWYGISQRRLVAKTGDEIFFRVTTDGSNLDKLEVNFVNNPDGDLGEVDFYYSKSNPSICYAKVTVLENDPNPDKETIHVTATTKSGKSLSGWFTFDRSDAYKYKEDILLTTTYNGELYGSSKMYSTAQRVLAKVGDTITYRAEALEGKITSAYYRVNMGEKIPLPIRDNAVGFLYKIPSDLVDGTYEVQFCAVSGNGNLYYLNQPIEIANDVVTANVYFVKTNLSNKYNPDTLMAGSIDDFITKELYANYDSNRGVVVNDSKKFYKGEWLEIDGISKDLVKEVNVFMDGAGHGGTGNYNGCELIPYSWYINADQVGYGNHTIKAEIITMNGTKYTFEFDMVIEKTASTLTLDVDLSKTYDYDDRLVIKPSSPLSGSYIVEVSASNGYSEKFYNTDSISIPVYKILFEGVKNGYDYRTTPITLSFNKVAPAHQLPGDGDATIAVGPINTNTHSNDSTLKVTDRYMKEVDDLVASLSEYAYTVTSTYRAMEDGFSLQKCDLTDFYKEFEKVREVDGMIVYASQPMGVPSHATLKFTTDGTYTRTAIYGVNNEILKASTNVENGKYAVDPATRQICYDGRYYMKLLNMTGVEVTTLEYLEEYAEAVSYSFVLGNIRAYCPTAKAVFAKTTSVFAPQAPTPTLSAPVGNAVNVIIYQHGIRVLDNEPQFNFIKYRKPDSDRLVQSQLSTNVEAPEFILQNGVEKNGILATIYFDEEGLVVKILIGQTDVEESGEIIHTAPQKSGDVHTTPTETVLEETTTTKVTLLNGDNKGSSATTAGKGTITEKDITIKWGDVLQLSLVDSQSEIKTIEIITEGIDTKYDISEFPTNVIVDPKDRNAERYVINYKYFDANGKAILDSEGNVIVDVIFDAAISK